MAQHEITREIGIDAGHRVTHHGSKCRNLHGHRYTIQATCRGPLFAKGEQQGMVLDFGFLKELMMQFIDANCDHGLILWEQDPLMYTLLNGRVDKKEIDAALKLYGAWKCEGVCGKMYIVPFVPTAEALAQHWFELLAERVRTRSRGNATLVKIRVWETPNSYADFACE